MVMVMVMVVAIAIGSGLAVYRMPIDIFPNLNLTRREAARQPIQQAVRTALVPIMYSMTVVGIISLPNMMMVQILARASPLEAVNYQIVIMFLIDSGMALGSVSVVLLSYRPSVSTLRTSLS
jgi:putative ABC transport system permease protein